MKNRNAIRLFSFFLCICLCFFSIVACQKKENKQQPEKTPEPPTTEESTTEESTTESNTAGSEENNESETTTPSLGTDRMSSLKLGVILLHDERSPEDQNFIAAVERTKTKLKLADDQVIYKKNIAADASCIDAAEALVDEGCNIIFASSSWHEAILLLVAKRYPDVEFCLAAGNLAHTENLANYHNAFAAIHTGKFLAGVAAGLKLTEMIETGTITADEAKMGYIAAFPYPENVSAHTAFYLGAKYICPSATMDVFFVDGQYESQKEELAAKVLILEGCVLISQDSVSLGGATTCEQEKVPFIASCENAVTAYPDSVIMSTSINWTPYFLYICNQFSQSEAIATDWTGTLVTDSIALSKINTDVAAKETQELLDKIKAKLISGEVQVFDTDTFTVNGMKLTSYEADVDADDNYTPDTSVIFDGYFHESEFRSAPYFDIKIDGIDWINWFG